MSFGFSIHVYGIAVEDILWFGDTIHVATLKTLKGETKRITSLRQLLTDYTYFREMNTDIFSIQASKAKIYLTNLV